MKIIQISDRSLFSLVAALIMNVTNAYAVPVYDITILRGPGNNQNLSGGAINDKRQVTGDISRDGRFRAFTTPPITNAFDADANASDPLNSFTNFFYNNLTDLGTFGGLYSRGRDINNKGQVAGWARDSSDATQAFISDPVSNTLTALDSLGGTRNVANGINDSSTVTGSSATGNFNSVGWAIQHAFVGDVNGITDIGTLGGDSSYGNDINIRGQVTGSSDLDNVPGGPQRAFVWDAVNGMIDIGALSGGPRFHGNSSGSAINNLGQVVGTSGLISYDSRGRRRDVQHAFLWDEVNGMTDLGTLFGPGIRGNSFGVDINDYGQAVGYSDSLRGGLTAFLWEDGVMYDLNELININQPVSGFVGGNVFMGINNAGDIIVGNKLLVRQQPNGVPEPAPFALMILGLMGFGIARRRHK
ncbi:MAG TPA: PEP-CTERM sorting domain-containing protein [Sphingomonadales bacterium]|nr:PEP-CTERM sorting domain-containing protein [Sphingomonadales bacterium]